MLKVHALHIHKLDVEILSEIGCLWDCIVVETITSSHCVCAVKPTAAIFGSMLC